MNYFELGLPKEYVNSLSGPQRIVEKEVAFKLFNYELRELIEVTKDKKSNLILITTPINLEVRPKETCLHSTTNNVVELQQEIENLLKEGNFKQAYPKALELSNETFSNAQSFYLLGRANMGLGNLAEARMNLSKASIFDCANWRGNAIYNSIMKSVAKKHQIRLIDFDQYLSSSLSKDGLFIDEIFPQNIFYQTMLKELQVNIKNILSVD
jgi:tetratricopeptide (TPR) repeat protein